MGHQQTSRRMSVLMMAKYWMDSFWWVVAVVLYRKHKVISVMWLASTTVGGGKGLERSHNWIYKKKRCDLLKDDFIIGLMLCLHLTNNKDNVCLRLQKDFVGVPQGQ